MFESLTGMFSGWMVSPALFVGGALLVASPIIIHLLNKRKFKRIDWAAMEFLLEADKRNRRRVRLENLILLLLRCLAVVLIALLVARPFRPLGLAGRLFESVSYERIVVLDDSISMQVRAGGESALDKAKQGLVEFVNGLASNDSDDSLRLVLASQPNRPLINDMPVNDETAGEIVSTLKDIQASDLPADFDTALLEIEKSFRDRSGSVNRVVYVLTDMRNRDWAVASRANNRKGAVETLRRLSEETAGCFLIDVANDDVSNLVVTGIIPKEKALVAGVPSRFDVTILNTGERDVGGVEVKFMAGESIPQKGEIESIPAGQTASIPFTYTFAPPQDNEPIQPVAIRAELTASKKANTDRLTADNVRYYAARVVAGIPTLIVDGDPSAAYGQAESFYLERALSPPGDIRSGISAETVTDAEFETLRLDNFQVIYLCNLYHVSEERRIALEKWVSEGGGLVIMLGDQIDEELYNEHLYAKGKGLLPIRLATIRGDETERQWVNFSVESANHPVLRVFEGESNPFLEGTKIFRWWESGLSEQEQKAGRVSVVARFTDGEKSPAIIEKAFGNGRVLVFTIPADNDWSSWPEEASFLITMQELNRYMSRKSSEEGTIAVGQPIRQPLDLTVYNMQRVTLTNPEREKSPLQAVPNTENGSEGDNTIWQVNYEETDRRGFYELELVRTDGETERLLFAANIDPGEGNLKRVDAQVLRRDLGDAPVELVSGLGLLSLGAEGAKGELWLYVLAALAIVLFCEQFLGWWFGLRR